MGGGREGTPCSDCRVLFLVYDNSPGPPQPSVGWVLKKMLPAPAFLLHGGGSLGQARQQEGEDEKATKAFSLHLFHGRRKRHSQKIRSILKKNNKRLIQS